MSNEHADQTEADRLATTGAETAARPDKDEVGPVSGDTDDASGDTGQEGGRPAIGADWEPSEAEQQQIAEDREERLDPENRPDHAEVNNAEREFDPTKGMFTDDEGYQEAEARFPPPAEQGV